MGIGSALYTGVSGLNTNGQAMTVIGNNLANTNTIAYKGSRTMFSDLLSSSVTGSGGTSQVGRGVGLSRVDNDFSQGTFESTSSGLDLAIEGNSFFLLSPSNDQSIHYSRAGSFKFNEGGYLVNPGGLRVQGIAYGADGELAGGDPSDIFLDGAGMIKGAATSEMIMNTNLDSNAKIFPIDFDASNTNSYNFSEELTLTGPATVPATVPPSNSTITAQTYYRKTAENSWECYYTAKETMADGTAGSSTAASIKAGEVEIDAAGNLVDTSSATTPKANFDPFATSIAWDDTGATTTAVTASTAGSPSSSIDKSLRENKSICTFDYKDPKTFTYSASVQIFDSLGNPHLISTYFRKTDDNTWDTYYSLEKEDGSVIPADPNAISLTQLRFGSEGQPVDSAGLPLDGPPTATTEEPIDWGNGSEPTPITVTFDTTQFNSSSKVISQEQNGYGAGNLSGVNIDEGGNVIAAYSNGKNRNIAAISLAKFQNPAGLTMEGNNLFAATGTSGAPRVGLPGPELGKVFTNSLEQSNVDMSVEFVRMITIQRGYQANSKIITTVDELLGELINLKR
ncbi:flagellar hook protein FlgE [Desulfotalea psychrophila]|uniref:Flagellar hook protein FlgE n=1 Tax=Desulfotalea psychrophila (strain LSv54 / DSM 12343) TaxID=177439 RepID=Q6AJT3_DESPS|nr:flagellar hook protein FlgE [Desulfotalea psychrophila]CAG37393.1 related to flagellar hook protein (FlgE) [Desulfotalea psychrophila LSv54]